ncbi:MAG TPA: dinitrogenase iron-molybdenum cofactor biosynthesis protein [Campylobacterales bacterium]|nr:dinitrogenase iron-molybdenum cofactor biosynthesis protein [Campylobacterales bacterium]HHS92924.1 dinitrogenase iron-molybdenum cofactor biosynthesis protein [Campylobacterales bacterium]
MIAIPLDTTESIKISKLYGNAPYFALLDPENGEVTTIENLECGNGPKSATFLNRLDVKGTLFYHMGEGVYNAFDKVGIDVFSVEKQELTLGEIAEVTERNGFVKLNSSNYKDLLDPGTNTASCQCGCEE